MKKVDIYTGNLCPYCFMAKKLLEENNILFTEYNIHQDEKNKAKMLSISNGKTSVPQIFFGSKHIGGYTDLEKLHEENKIFEILTN